jgi:peptide/nickel transport system permease protein
VGPLARGDERTQAPVSLSPTQLAMLRLKENRTFKVSCVIFLSIVIMCVAAPVFERYWAGRSAADQNLSGSVMIGGKQVEAVAADGTPNIGPGFHLKYTLGSDELGRDVFMRALEGGRVSLLVGFGAALFGMAGAVVLGTAAGFKRGWVDTIISQWVDFMLCMPVILLMVAVSTALAMHPLGPIHRGSILLLILVLGFGAMPGMTRMIRGLVLGLAEKEFVEAARALGGGDARVMFRHMLPNISNALVTYFGLMVSGMIIAEAGMSFLGLGILPPGMSWGSGIADGSTYYMSAAWITMVPGLFIVLTTTSVNLIGMAVEEAFDPKNLGGR